MVPYYIIIIKFKYIPMFTKFKQKFRKVTPQSQQLMIDQIHHEFDTASENALEEAKKIISIGLNESKVALIDKLKVLGFSNANLVLKSVHETDELRRANLNSEIVIKYKVKYPQYKFIFTDQVLAICKKYGLILGPSEKYIGDIPVKNIEEISSFKVDAEDQYYQSRGVVYNTSQMLKRMEDNKTKKSKEKSIEFHNDLDPRYMRTNFLLSRFLGVPFNLEETFVKQPFMICAPLKDMKIEENEVIKNNQIEMMAIQDPVVLHYVREGYLIVSKWGIEAEDEILK